MNSKDLKKIKKEKGLIDFNSLKSFIIFDHHCHLMSTHTNPLTLIWDNTAKTSREIINSGSLATTIGQDSHLPKHLISYKLTK